MSWNSSFVMKEKVNFNVATVMKV